MLINCVIIIIITCILMLPTASGLVLYQCLTRYTASNSSEISLNKDDMVKVRDKKDHGMPEYRVTGMLETTCVCVL